MAELDTRGPVIRRSLKTDDVAEARAKRDVLEAADHDYWSALLLGEGEAGARLRFEAARRRAEALGFSYRTSSELASGPLNELIERVLAIMPKGTPAPVEDAILGLVDRPKATWWEAFDVYKKEIVSCELLKKSPGQLKRWEAPRKKAISTFLSLVGNKPIADTTRQDAQTIYRHWLNKLAPSDRAAKRYATSTANKQIGMLRTLYDENFQYQQVDVARNPFSRLSFSGPEGKRPPFSNDWVQNRLLAPGALAGLNAEARGITLAMIETHVAPENCAISPRTTSTRSTPSRTFTFGPGPTPTTPGT